MASIWETLGEKVGYALAAIVLGPPAAIARRERRAMRTALDAWCEELGAERLVGPGRRRSGKLPGAAGSFPFEVKLDVLEKRAWLDVAIERLPPVARASFAKAPWALYNVKMRLVPPLASVEGIGADSNTLDASTCEALAREIADGAVGSRDTFALELDGERILLHVVAPREAAEWKALGVATAAFADSCVRRWGSSYR